MNSSKAIVSVIIPTYNSSATIMRALESAFSQTYAAWEIIVVDDGSTDNTKELLQSYSDSKKIKYLYQENGGPGAARNNGIQHATGEYVAFLDADDYWHTEKLERQIAVFSDHPDCVVCYTDSYEIDPYSEIVWDVRQKHAGKLRSGWVLPHIVFKNFVTLASAVVPTQYMKKIGGFTPDRKLVFVEDYDAWLSLAQLGTFHAVDMPLMFYQTRHGITREQKIINNRKLMRLFVSQIIKSSFKNKHWYLAGLVMVSIKWVMHSVLQWVHL